MRRTLESVRLDGWFRQFAGLFRPIRVRLAAPADRLREAWWPLLETKNA